MPTMPDKVVFLTDCGVTVDDALDEFRNLVFAWKRKHGVDAVIAVVSFFEEACGPGGSAKFRPETVQYGNPDLCCALINRVIDTGVGDDRVFAVSPDEGGEYEED